MKNMSTVLICVILAAICVYAVISYRKKLSSGCCGGGGEIAIKPEDTNLSHYPYKTTVLIDGMTCAHCKLRVENTFNNMDGFYVKVNLKKKCAELWSKKEIDEEIIKKAVEKAGYTYVGTEK